MFRLFTDSSCNLPDSIIKERQIDIVSLDYLIDDKVYTSFINGRDNDEYLKQNYDSLRKKIGITTSCANENDFITAFESALMQGEDILYIGFSSALSATFQNSQSAAEQLLQKYPSKKIICIDSLCASMGEGLLVTYADDMRKSGKEIEDVAQWLTENRKNINHWFTVGDLYYLFKGGRVKRASYYIGSILKIKPIMHVDDAGRLVPVSKVMGRKKSISALADKVVSDIVNPQNQTIMISHGDCIEDAQSLLEQITSRLTVKQIIINYVDIVIGAHSGPDTLAVFFVGNGR